MGNPLNVATYLFPLTLCENTEGVSGDNRVTTLVEMTLFKIQRGASLWDYMSVLTKKVEAAFVEDMEHFYTRSKFLEATF